MVLKFNENGVLTDTTLEPIRQGDTVHVVKATFEGKNPATHIARIGFTRNDGQRVVDMLMTPQGDSFIKQLDNEWFFAVAGSTTLTVYLNNVTGQTVASGRVYLTVEETDYDHDPTITPEQYNDLLSLIAGKLDISRGVIYYEDLENVKGDEIPLSELAEGQIIYNKADKAVYTIENGSIVLFAENPQVAYEKIISGETVVGRANADSEGSEFAETYEKIEDHNADIDTVNADIERVENTLNTRIDLIEDKSDVTDIVGTYEELETYDTSSLGDNDIIKVLKDSTHDNRESYFRYSKGEDTFTYIGSSELYLTETQADSKYLAKDSETVDYVESLKNHVVQNENKTEIGGDLEVDGKVQVNTYADFVDKEGHVVGMSAEEKAKLEKAFVIPTPAITEFELVGVNPSKEQVRVKLGDNMSYDPTTKKINATGGGIAEVNWGDITGTVTDQHDLVTYVKEQVAGKNSKHILSYAEEPVTEQTFFYRNYYKKDGTRLTSYAEFKTYVGAFFSDEPECKNSIFNTQEKTLQLGIPRTGKYLIFRKNSQDWSDRVIYPLNQPLTIGDDIVVVENEVPDWWIGNEYGYLYAFETKAYATKEYVDEGLAKKPTLDSNGKIASGVLPFDFATDQEVAEIFE